MQAEEDSGFNRNIVECKEAPQAGRGAGRSVLIETLWNVNFCFTAAKQILGVF